MKEILLTKGFKALVDDEDFDMLSNRKWFYSHGYAFRMIMLKGKRTKLAMHTELINTPKGMEIDHIDRNKLNNQKHNLRITTHKGNMSNVLKVQRGKYSKYRGITRSNHHNLWVLQVRLKDGTRITKYFKNEEDAARRYNEIIYKDGWDKEFLNEI